MKYFMKTMKYYRKDEYFMDWMKYNTTTIFKPLGPCESTILSRSKSDYLNIIFGIEIALESREFMAYLPLQWALPLHYPH